MSKWSGILETIQSDPRYVEGLTYGKPRKGHAEGTVDKHIAELDQTLELIYRADHMLMPDEYEKLKIIIHAHDTFKLEGKRRTGHQVSIRDPNSHASLARKFLEEFTDDKDILSITQFHDEGHSLWQKWQKRGSYSRDRLRDALSQITNHDLYAIFTIIDGYTPSKLMDRSPRWFIEEMNNFVETPRAHQILKLLNL